LRNIEAPKTNIKKLRKSLLKEASREHCNQMNISNYSTCYVQLKTQYKNTSEFANYYTTLFADNPDEFKNEIIISEEQLLRYVHANIGSTIQVSTPNELPEAHINADRFHSIMVS
jgi:hypothetical protein